MSEAKYATCSICGRSVALNGSATNLAGESVMVWHYREYWQRCDGSNLSPAKAAMKANKYQTERC